jgi:hypothetical protein
VRLVCGAILDDDPRMRFFPRMIFQLAARSTRSCYVTLFFEALGPVQHDLRSLSSSFNESQHTKSDSSALSEHEPIPTPFFRTSRTRRLTLLFPFAPTLYTQYPQGHQCRHLTLNSGPDADRSHCTGEEPRC